MTDGTSEAYTFDAVYNITKIQTANEILNYTHDKTGRITSKNTTDYSYDAIGRLTQAGPESFSYDVAGNILNNNASYDTKNNRLLANDLYSVTYDALGNIKSKYDKLTKETTTYTFDTRNRLVKYVKQDENNQTVKTLEFAYDALGRRVSKTEDGVTQKYLYDGDDIIAILDNDNNVIATITHDESIDTPLSITNANGTFYYHRDHQGSILSLTDQEGNEVEHFTYDNHYGRIVAHTKTVETNNPYGYTGRVVDTQDLYYYRARYYDPTIQRFISEDPIGFASGDFNFYRYVGDDPVDLVDPWGDTAYNCKVPLHAFPDSWGLPYMYHQYTCVVIDGKTTCGGQDRSGNFFWSPGKPSQDHYVPGKCRRRKSNKCFEQCLLKKWSEPRPQYGIPFGTDCQEYDDKVNKECWDKCKDKK